MDSLCLNWCEYIQAEAICKRCCARSETDIVAIERLVLSYFARAQLTRFAQANIANVTWFFYIFRSYCTCVSQTLVFARSIVRQNLVKINPIIAQKMNRGRSPI